MRRICENSVFGEISLPDFSGWEDAEIIEMCDTLYYNRVFHALENIGLYWNDRESAVYTDGDYTGADPVADFKEIDSRVFDDIINMSEAEIRAAYKKEGN